MEQTHSHSDDTHVHTQKHKHTGNTHTWGWRAGDTDLEADKGTEEEPAEAGH